MPASGRSTVWGDQAAQWSDRPWLCWAGEARSRRGGLLKSPSVARRAEALIEMGKTARAGDRPLMAIVNYEASYRDRAMRDLLKNAQWDAVILDESHRIKLASGKASRLATDVCARVRDRGGVVIALTGTPMPHDPLDLFAQVRALDGGERFGTSEKAFRVRYASRATKPARGGEPITLIDSEGRPLWCPARRLRGEVIRRAEPDEPLYLVGPRMEPIYAGLSGDSAEEFYDKVASLWHRVRSDEVLDLPDATDVHRTCQLSSKARAVYKALERDLIAQLNTGDASTFDRDVLAMSRKYGVEGVQVGSTTYSTGRGITLTAANAMVLVTRLAQVTSGFGKDAETGETIQIDDPPAKASLLADVLEDLDRREPVVVFCRFHHDLDQVRRVAENGGRRYAEVSGRQRDALDGPRMRGDVDVAGVQIQAGGVGIDLTRARHAIYYSVDFALGDYLQSRKRLHRQGQHRNVLYTHLLADDSIDRAIYGALQKREQVIDVAIDHLNKRTRP